LSWPMDVNLFAYFSKPFGLSSKVILHFLVFQDWVKERFCLRDAMMLSFGNSALSAFLHDITGFFVPFVMTCTVILYPVLEHQISKVVNDQ